MDRLHSKISTSLSRSWYSDQTKLSKTNFMWPLFISYKRDAWEPLSSLPEQIRVGVDRLVELVKPHVEKGLSSVLLFGLIPPEHKDGSGSRACDPEINPVIAAVKILRQNFPQLYVACDVCLCAYTSHGHCGEIFPDGRINNVTSTKLLAKVALTYAQAGCHCVAPSDMMDGRVTTIKEALHSADLDHILVMAYSAKFASSLYGPFRDAADCSPQSGDRKCYQLPPGSRGLALQAAIRDANEGADIVMVKPGSIYLDVLEAIRTQLPNHCLAVYHVSGEYCMLYHAAKAGSVDFDRALLEVMVSFKRAGATVIITYFTPRLLGMNLDFA